MVTDDQYKALQQRVAELEHKYALLSKQYSTLYMKRDMHIPFAPTSITHKDTTKYLFDKQLHNKRKLVLACVKKYVNDHPDLSGNELLQTFPEYIQGSLGVIRKASEAEKYSSANSRFYFNDQDLIILHGETYVVCAQWDKNNISRFISLMRDLNYEIIEQNRVYH